MVDIKVVYIFRKGLYLSGNIAIKMVIYALLETNVRDVVLDPVVDKIHRVKYRNDRDGNHVILKDNGGRDHIITAGRLALLDVQCPENPVVAAFGGSLFTGEYQRAVPPRADEFHRFSTLFELERLAIDAVEVHGLAELNADGTRSILPDQKYFQEQKTAVDGFIAAYAHAV